MEQIFDKRYEDEGAGGEGEEIRTRPSQGEVSDYSAVEMVLQRLLTGPSTSCALLHCVTSSLTHSHTHTHTHIYISADIVRTTGTCVPYPRLTPTPVLSFRRRIQVKPI